MSALIGEHLDHYRLVDQIGQGGMATVYRAEDTRDDSIVAVKVLSPGIGTDRRFIRRFRREAHLVSELRHPNIVPVLEYGQTRGYVYTAMPFVQGETLHVKIARGQIRPEDNAAWVSQIASALQFSHDHGVVHRDIKPSNLMIDENNQAMLMDFGLARVVEGHSSLTGSMLMGTPAYISPEQGRGEEIDERSDQYSLGIILYEMATGRLPFDSDAPMALVMQHIQEPVPRPRRFNPDLSPEVEAVILKALAKKRDLRFESVGELNQAYQAAMAGEPLPNFEVPVDPVKTQVRAAPRPMRASPTVMEDALPPSRSRSWALLVAIPILLGIAIVSGVWFARGGLANPSTDGGVAPILETEAPVAPVATETNTAPATATLHPTPISSASCPGITLAQLQSEGNRAQWLLDNGSDERVGITDIPVLIWPTSENGELLRILFGDEVILEREPGSDEGAVVINTSAGFLEPFRSLPLALEFEYAASQAGYEFGVMLDAGCTLQGEW